LVPTNFKPPAVETSLDDQPELVETLARLRGRIGVMLETLERQLPPERQLSAEYGVGRAAIRKALAILQHDGLVVRRVGRGTFITSAAGTAPPHLQALAEGGALAIGGQDGVSVRELLEVRFALEPAIAELAAVTARKGDLARMQECLQKREEAAQLDAYEHWDYALHMSIAKATQNRLLMEMLDLVNRMRRSGTWRKFRGRTMKPNDRRRSNAQHRAIVHAIAQADPAGAFSAMRIHVGLLSSGYAVLAGAEQAEDHEA
jgi:GntR family transcriptional repressor for pyruvate dehydrogenase complex